jgi:hypothetical protein
LHWKILKNLHSGHVQKSNNFVYTELIIIIIRLKTTNFNIFADINQRGYYQVLKIFSTNSAVISWWKYRHKNIHKLKYTAFNVITQTVLQGTAALVNHSGVRVCYTIYWSPVLQKKFTACVKGAYIIRDYIISLQPFLILQFNYFIKE